MFSYLYRSIFIFVYLLLYSSYSFSDIVVPKSFNLKWPIEKNNQPYTKISSTFGESRLDHFHNGLDVPGEGLPVYNLNNGILLWGKQGKSRSNEIPFGGGKTVIIEHSNFWSGYMHLNEIESLLYTLQPQDKIGISGKTGHSGGAHLHFFIYDPQVKKYYNPLLLYDKSIVIDTKPPILKGYFVKNTLGALVLTKTAKDLDVQNPLFAFLQDSGISAEKWGIYTFKVYTQENNITKIIYNFVSDYIYFDGLHWLASNHQKFEDIYASNQYSTHLKLTNVLSSKDTYYIEATGFTGPSFVQKIILSK